MPFDDHAIQRHLLARLDDEGLPYRDFIRADAFHLSIALHIGHVGTNVHQVRNAFAALALGIALKQLADLEKQHDKDRLRKLCLGTRQKPDTKCPDGRYRHQEMLVERLAMSQTFGSLLERIETDEKIRNQINKQQLPCGQIAVFLDDHRCNQKDYGDSNFDDLPFQAAFMLVMMLVFATLLVMMMFVMMCHD